MSAPHVLAGIYQDDSSIVVYPRTNSDCLNEAVDIFLKENPNFQTTLRVSSTNGLAEINQLTDGVIPMALADNMASLVEMFCELFEINSIRLRLVVSNSIMCPRFHTDRVSCRLITCYSGPATEWLPYQAVDRSKLGLGNNGLPDHLSGLYQDAEDIHQLACGDVALFKGTLWPGGEELAQVHRSPVVGAKERRLVLTLDFVDE